MQAPTVLVQPSRVPNLGRIRTLIEPPDLDGSILGVDKRKLDEFPFLLTTDPPNQNPTIVARQASDILTARVSAQGPLEIAALSAKRTGTMLVLLQIKDGKTPFSLMNGPLHIDAIIGSNTLPYRLAEAIYLDERRSLDVRYTDISTSTNACRLIAHGAKYISAKYDPRLQLIRKRLATREFISIPFWYGFDTGPVTLTALGTSQQTISIAADHHFELFKISAVSTSGLYNLNIVDVSTGKSIIDGPGNSSYEVSAGLWVGDNQFPFVLPEPVLFEAGTKLLVSLTDRSNASNTIHLALHGRLIKVRMWA